MTAAHFAGGRHQGHDATLGQLAQFLQRRAGGQLRLVARREFVEPFRLMVVPLTQFLGRRNVFAPDSDAWVILADPSRPDAIDQDALAVVGADVFVDPRGPDLALRGHARSISSTTGADVPP